MQVGQAPSLVSQFGHEIVITVLVTVFLAIIVWPIKRAKKEWISLREQIGGVAQELSVQRNNCLKTIQEHSSNQVELQKKTNEILEEIKLDQRELVVRISK